MRSGDILDGRYLLDQRIGIGGMGEVWRADDVENCRVVAIKRLHEKLAERSVFVARFLREARAAMKTCGSPHIIEVLDVVNEPGAPPYLVMEFLVGETLSSMLRRRGSLPRTTAIDVALQTALALAEVHKHGVVHRDIKPGNLFLTHTLSGRRFIKILDFGVAKLLDSDDDDGFCLTCTGVLIGTIEYMPPEQIFGSRDLDHRADIYALGKVLYHMLAGQQPPPEPDIVPQPEECKRRVFPLRMYRPEIDERLERVVIKAMARDRTKRFDDMEEMALALESCLVNALLPLQDDEEDTLMTPPPPECMEIGSELDLQDPTTLDNVFVPSPTDVERDLAAYRAASLACCDTERHPVSITQTIPSIECNWPLE